MNSQGTSAPALQTTVLQDKSSLANRVLQEKNMPITRRYQTRPGTPTENRPNMKKRQKMCVPVGLILIKLKNDGHRLKNGLLP